MRRFLDRLYDAGLWLSATAFGLIALLVAVQIVGRLTDRTARALDLPPPGIVIPSLAEFGAFLFAGAVFLGLAGTLQAGGHVRVKLVTQALPEAVARPLAAVVALAAACLAAFATWSSGLQALDSHQFNSVSYGTVPIPLAIPQGVMTFGLALFTVALVDAAVTLARGGTPGHVAAEQAAGEGS